MKFVQPIRDIRNVEAIKHYLKVRSERDYILFMVGINTGFRISDILSLSVKDVRGTHIEIIEGKTQKRKKIKIRKTLRKALDDYIKGKQDYEYLFTGRSKKHSGLIGEPIDSSTAYKALSKAAHANGVEEIGTHSMRKTFGYHFYLKTRDIALLMELFNHSEQTITLRYIGIKQDSLDEAMDEFEL
ncbi:tyrosine-type recombinase/integrase [Paenibacillus eucommiae]|uniref:Integrase n=1 Tax=Paenibacillus eucommiae TaxID=1355755 RepID=A0ABS4J162_9BACL|nr:tyrosine-type recombinase/integrase [Paenibacillus eucommiae]MBP1992534.1 integrase [Paenibacillus eucommiae]